MHLERFQNQKFSYPGEGDTPSPRPYPPADEAKMGKDIKKEDVEKMIRWGNRDNSVVKMHLERFQNQEFSHPLGLSCRSSREKNDFLKGGGEMIELYNIYPCHNLKLFMSILCCL